MAIPPLAACILAFGSGIRSTATRLFAWNLFGNDLRIHVVKCAICVADTAATIASLLVVFRTPRRIIFCDG